MDIDPAKLKIEMYPEPVLRKRAEPIPEITPLVKRVAQRMIELMHEAEGAGLAAPQVGLSWRLFVAEVPPDEGRGRSLTSNPITATPGPVVYINPVLSNPAGPVEAAEEGCLSLPKIWGDVIRPPIITIRAMDENGKVFEQTGTGLLARCWQHEVDHLDGVLFLDRMTQASRLKNRARVRDLERDAGVR